MATLPALPVERRAHLNKSDLRDRFLGGEGLPVIVTDANWPSFDRWSLDFFRSRYGNDIVLPGIGHGARLAKRTSLSAYIDHLGSPERELAGVWAHRATGRPAPPPSDLQDSDRFYLLTWFAFHRHPELLQDVAPLYWIRDFTRLVRRPLEWIHRVDYWSLFLGPEGTVTPLHKDFAHTYGSLAQIRGRKRVLLFSPEETPLLYHGLLDPERPDFSRFPLFEFAQAYECVLEPGEILFWPPNWWHHVRGLEPTISVSHNFFDHRNGLRHLRAISRDLPQRMRDLAEGEKGPIAPHSPSPP